MFNLRENIYLIMEARQNSTKIPLINQDFVIRDSMINNPNFTNRPSIIKDEKKGIFKALLAFMTFGFTSFQNYRILVKLVQNTLKKTFF